ncbi:low molecular weight protein-tyrosine-phosphatase [Acanthopleuribacter pedis]|uniref:protein-tyrosine-phosphatase n=1 Tax=Acanthopleuribacter pedis TaxID=442870 RepID=A0A8J7QBE0_9BACT|nr:low molecular weight protein-tyrosine-phosphatase [Acanthopleuribacter pedis]MBO1322456.1 low molecular weight phosphotyrosine protein phosphatase [Acanthopleuribacter pedis]
MRVLFVCTGNICRSPTAEGIFRTLVEEAGLSDTVATDSAGMIAYHTGEPPDPRSARYAAEQGYPIDDLRARQVQKADFEAFDLLLAMDQSHHADLLAMAPEGTADRVRLFLTLDETERDGDVPDPYYGGPEGFAATYALIERGCRQWLTWICRQDNR